MAQSFNLVARLQLQGPQNITQIVNRIQSRLQNIQANIALNVPTGANTALKNFNTSLSQTNTILQQVTNNANAAAAALGTVATGMKATGVSAARATKNTRAASQNMKQVATETKVAATEMAEFGRISALAVRRFLAFSIPAGILVGLVVNIKQGVRAAIDFEREMVRVQQVTGKSATALSALTNEIGRLSSSIGVASNELVQVSRTLAQAGLSAKETRIAMAAIARTDLAPTFDNMTQTTEGAIAAMRQFGLAADQLQAKLGAMNAVAGSFAVESADIISAIRRTGGAFGAAGGNLEELIALFTSVRSTTRESADSIATGFRTIFTRLQRPRTIQFLRDLNIELQEAGKFVGPFEAVKRLSIALEQLDPRDVRFSRITEELGGFRQVSKVIPLIQQFATSQKALSVALSGTTSVAEDARLAQASLAVQLTKVHEIYAVLFRDVAGSNTFKNLATFALNFAKSLEQVLRQLKPVVPLITAIGLFKGASIARQFGAGFIGGFKSIGQGAGTQAATQANTQAQTKNTTVVSQSTAQTAKNAAATATSASNMAATNTLLGKLDTTMVSLIASINALNKTMLSRSVGVGGSRSKGRKGFASGGLVPGLGTGDTVPAMLQPGEFVMRKRAVDAVGAGALGGLNARRYADGSPGGVKDLTVAERGTLAALTKTGFKARTAKEQAQFRALNKRSMAAVAARRNIAVDVGGRHGVAFLNDAGVSGITRRQSTSITGLENESSDAASIVRSRFPASRFNIASVSSSPQMFSATKGAQLAFQNQVVTPIGGLLKNASQQALGLNEFKTIPFDNLVSKVGFKSTIGNLFEAYVRAATHTRIANNDKEPAFDIQSVGSAKNFQGLFGAGISKAIPLEIKTGTSVLPANLIGKMIRHTGGSTLKSIDVGSGKKFAAGGRATDTVPALLTPGEFVVNRQAAQSVGYTKLNAINNMRGYAAGGAVRKYAAGSPGGVSPNVGRGAGTSLTSVFIISSMLQSFIEVDSTLGNLVSTLTQVVIGFEALRLAGGVLQGFVGTLKGLKMPGGGINPNVRALFGGSRVPISGTMGAMRNRVKGPFSSANVLSEQFTGLSAKVLGMGAAVVAVSAGLWYLSTQQEAAANETAKNAKSEKEMRKAAIQARTGKVLRSAAVGVGAGALAGGAIGALGGPIGIAIGAAIGGLGGVLIGAFGRMDARLKELRAISRAGMGARADERLAVDLPQLLSGRTGLAGSVEFGRVGKDIGTKLANIRSARTDGTEEEFLTNKRSMRALLPQFDELTSKLLAAGASIEDFTMANSTGANIVRSVAELRNQSSKAVLRGISDEIEARRHSIISAEEFSRSMSEANSSLRMMREFNASLVDASHRMVALSTHMGVLSDLAQGNVALGEFGGRPGFGDFARIGTSGIADQPQFLRALEQATGGVGGDDTFERLRDLTTMMGEIPGMLQQIAGEVSLDKDSAASLFADLASERFAGLIDSEQVINRVSGQLNAMVTASGESGGTGQFRRLASEDAQALFSKLGGKDLAKSFEEAEKSARIMQSMVKQLDSQVRSSIALELQVFKKRLQLEQQRFKDESTLARMRNTSGVPRSVAEITAQKGRTVSGILSGTGIAAGTSPFDTAAIGGRLREVNKQIAALNEERQSAKILNKELTGVTSQLRDLSVEGSKLRTALTALTDITEEAAQIQKTLNLLEENKKARFSLAERYTFGTREDRQKILQSIRDTVAVHAGDVDIDRLSGARRAGVLGMQNAFPNTPAAMFGIDPATGRLRTGQQGSARITTGRVGGIQVPDFAQPFFGPDLRAQMEGARPDKVNAEEEAQISLMSGLFNRRAEAEAQFLTNVEAQHTKLLQGLQSELTNLPARFAAEQARSKLRGAERAVASARIDVAHEKSMEKAARDAVSLIQASGGRDDLTLGGGGAAAKAFAESTETVQAIREGLSGQDTIRSLAGAFGGGGLRGAIAGFGTTPSADIGALTTSTRGIFKGLLEGRRGTDIGAGLQDFLNDLSDRGVTLNDDAIKNLVGQFDTERKRAFEVVDPLSGAISFKDKPSPITSNKLDAFMSKALGQFATDIQKPLDEMIDGLATAARQTASVVTTTIRTGRDEPLVKMGRALAELDVAVINKLPASVATLNERLKELDTILRGMPTLAAIDAGLVTVDAAGLALGGSIFKNQGTDTVPAMLTPGEFVVNRASTQKNMGLLHAINRGDNVGHSGGVMYAAGGGLSEEKRDELWELGMGDIREARLHKQHSPLFALHGVDSRITWGRNAQNPQYRLKYRRYQRQRWDNAGLDYDSPVHEAEQRRHIRDRQRNAAGEAIFGFGLEAASRIGGSVVGAGRAVSLAAQSVFHAASDVPIQLPPTEESLMAQLSPHEKTLYERRKKFRSDKLNARQQFEQRRAGATRTRPSNLERRNQRNAARALRIRERRGAVTPIERQAAGGSMTFAERLAGAQARVAQLQADGGDARSLAFAQGTVERLQKRQVASQAVKSKVRELRKNKFVLTDDNRDERIAAASKRRAEAASNTGGTIVRNISGPAFTAGETPFAARKPNRAPWARSDSPDGLSFREFLAKITRTKQAITFLEARGAKGNELDKKRAELATLGRTAEKWLNRGKTNKQLAAQSLFEQANIDIFKLRQFSAAQRRLAGTGITEEQIREDFGPGFKARSSKQNVLRDLVTRGQTGKTSAYDDTFRQRRPPRKFHTGGMVHGVGDQSAILQGGEYVVSRNAVQALAKGGVAKGYQEGGRVASGAGEGGTIEISLSSEAQSSMAGMSEALRGVATDIRQAFAEVPNQITNALSAFPAQLESSAQIINEASATFQAGAMTMQESVQTLPVEIAAALNESGAVLLTSTQSMGEAVTGLSTAAETLNQGVAQMAAMVTDIATAFESMRGAAMDIRDALAQEIQITVTHSHEPITVTVVGGETTTQNGDAFEEMVMNVVGPQIDALRDRIRETGFGIA